MEDKNEEKFSDDPIENLRIENELLRLKLDAQYGENFKMETDGSLPPEVEHMFLNQVLNFEEQMKNQVEIRLQDKLDIKDQPLSAELSDEEVTERLQHIESVMKANNLFLDRIHGPYPDREIYDFITLELFDHKTAATSMFNGHFDFDLSDTSDPLKDDDDVHDSFDHFTNIEDSQIDDAAQEEDYDDSEDYNDDSEHPQLQNINGWHFIYEEFRPNHQEDIKSLCNELLESYQQRETGKFGFRLGDEVITPAKNAIPKEAAVARLQAFFDSFTSFEDFEYSIMDTRFQEEGKFMIGHCMGDIKFSGVMENGERLSFEEPFGFYLDHDGYEWQIFSMVLPGFNS